MKLLWLAICTIEDECPADRARDRGVLANERKAQGRLVEGQGVTIWKRALAQLEVRRTLRHRAAPGIPVPPAW